MISPARLKAKQKAAQEAYELWAEQGISQKDIGKKLGVSKQWVGQLIKWHMEVSQRKTI